MWHQKKKENGIKKQKNASYFLSLCVLELCRKDFKAPPGYDKALIIDVFEESPSTIAVTEGQPTRVLIGETLVV